MSAEVPLYRDLPLLADTGEHHAWGVFGPDDQLGTVNFITREATRRALAGVRRGEVVNLNLRLDTPSPSLSSSRKIYRHTVSVRRTGRDDSLDDFYLQASTQWDGLRHIRYRQYGYYRGLQEDDLERQDVLGMQVLAERGIVGRGLLLDVAGYYEAQGQALAADERTPFDAALLERVLAHAGEEVEPGDVLLVRTGWLRWYMSREQAQQQALEGYLDGSHACPGLDAGAETAGWLWDHRVSAVATDNPAVEALPVLSEVGFLHRRLIALLGMPLGELWDLEVLARRCAEYGCHHFALTSAPLNIPRGVGSPANALAVL